MNYLQRQVRFERVVVGVLILAAILWAVRAWGGEGLLLYRWGQAPRGSAPSLPGRQRGQRLLCSLQPQVPLVEGGLRFGVPAQQGRAKRASRQ